MPEPTPSLSDLGIDPEAADRLLPHVDSFVKWELLRFLHDNPETAATIEDLARYMGRDETELKPATRALVNAGLCRHMESAIGSAFAITDDESLRQMISHLVNAFVADRLVRLAISSHILKARRSAGRLETVVQ